MQRMRLCALLLVLVSWSPTLAEENLPTVDDGDVGDIGNVGEPSGEALVGLDQTGHNKVGEVLRDFEQTILDSELNTTLDSLEPGLKQENQTSNLTSPEVSKPRLSCIPINLTDTAAADERQVQILNGTELQLRIAEENNQNVTNRTYPGVCSLTFFYGAWCPFSAAAAPFFNALPRYYPGLNFYAIEAGNNVNILAQFGVIALPSVIAFHNSRPLYGFNSSEHTLEEYIQFITTLTGIQAEQKDFKLLDEDFQGPIPTVAVKGFNYNLLLASLFLMVCGVVNLSKSAYFTSLTETLRNAWREVEIQHEHTD